MDKSTFFSFFRLLFFLTILDSRTILHEPEANERGEAGNVASSESLFLGAFIIDSHSILGQEGLRLKALFPALRNLRIFIKVFDSIETSFIL